MDLVHNGRRRHIDARFQPQLGTVLDSCAEGGLRVIEQVSIDGIALGDDEIGELRELSTRGTGELVVRSREVELVARDGIESSAQYARCVRDSFLRAAEGFRLGQVQSASALLGSCADAVEVLLYVIGRIARTLDAEASDLDDWADSLTVPFAELVERHERADWLGVSDLLEYELAARVGAFAEGLADLHDRAKRTTDAAARRVEA